MQEQTDTVQIIRKGGHYIQGELSSHIALCPQAAKSFFLHLAAYINEGILQHIQMQRKLLLIP